jgi:hypothetical protein
LHLDAAKTKAQAGDIALPESLIGFRFRLSGSSKKRKNDRNLAARFTQNNTPNQI